MNILFYTPFNNRSRDTESLMIQLKERGHNIFYVSQNYGASIQQVLQEKGVNVFNSPLAGKLSLWTLFKEVVFLIKFCRRHRIEVVFSHLESANFIAALVQYFIKANVYIGRHHVDELHLIGKQNLLSYRLTYRLARRVIVVSRRAKEFMVREENIDPAKIDVINLSYDFDLYPSVNTINVGEIRKKYACRLLLVTACRLVKDKRPDSSIGVLEKLVQSGIDAKLLILGGGELFEELKKIVVDRNLSERCFVLGRVENILDYLAASDVLLHPSLLDSSSVIVKEAGLVRIPVVVCAGVGDVDDYIVNGENGIVVDKDNFKEESAGYLKNIDRFFSEKEKLGNNLHTSVEQLFSVHTNIHYYDKYLK
jgi:glycosyltransferase involved in cell wall biosynthesis